MSRSRAYKRTDVKQVDLAALRERTLEFGNAGVTVGLDIGTGKMCQDSFSGFRGRPRGRSVECRPDH